MYTFHFYSGSHGSSYRERVTNAINSGTPVFISEFGICDSSGNGNIQTAEADLWMDFCDKYNISHACWSASNADEDASYFKSSCTRTSKWTEDDLRDTGVWLVNTYRKKEAKECGGGSGNGSSSSSDSSSSGNSSSGSSSSGSSSSGSSSSGSSSSGSSSSGSSSSDSSSSSRDNENSSSVPHHSGDSSTGSSDSSRRSSDSSSNGSSSGSSKSSSDSGSSDSSRSDSSSSGSSKESSESSKSSSDNTDTQTDIGASSGVVSPDTGMIKVKIYSVGTGSQEVKVSYNAVLCYTGKNPIREDFFKSVKVPVTVDPKWAKYLTVKKVTYKNGRNAYVSDNPAYLSVTKKPAAVVVMALNDTGKAFKKTDKAAGKELSAYLKSLNQAMKSDPILFEINPADLSKMAVTAKKYNREKSKLSGVKVSAPGFKIRGIKQGKDFDIVKDSFNEKDGSVIIAGKGNYTGLKKL
jgi:hypothetical protein